MNVTDPIGPYAKPGTPVIVQLRNGKTRATTTRSRPLCLVRGGERVVFVVGLQQPYPLWAVQYDEARAAARCTGRSRVTPGVGASR